MIRVLDDADSLQLLATVAAVEHHKLTRRSTIGA